MERPSVSWKEYLTEHKSWEKAARASYELYLRKYAKSTIDDKPKEKFDDKVLIPGKIYSFLYVTPEKPSDKRPFINRRPILLSMGRVEKGGKVLETGIDLMVVPPKVRIPILDNFYKYYKDTIEDNDKNISEDRKGKKAAKINYAVARGIFSKLGWQNAFSVFDRAKMAKISVVDYDDWAATIPLQTNALQGQQAKEIFERYIKEMGNPSEKNLI